MQPNMPEKQKNNIKMICVFCGASPGRDPEYVELAKQLGKEMVRRGYGLVYGGGSYGLMGTLARTVHEAGGRVVGIIPEALKKVERPELDDKPNEAIFGEEIVVPDMHTRKGLMNKMSDAFCALPGGYGTFEELLEVTTWSQLSIHTKPVIIFNMKGYYNHLLKFIQHAIDEKFVVDWSANVMVPATTAEEVLDKMEVYEPPKSRFALDWNTNLDKPKESFV